MLSVLTIRDFLWLVLVGWMALYWELDTQVKELDVSEQKDNAAIYQADNSYLERENTRHMQRIQQLEARAPSQAWSGGL